MKYLVDYSLIYPMFAMVLLTFLVGGITLRARFRGARSKDVPMKYFKLLQGDAPEYMLKPSRHFNNLFETPTLYYAACLAAIVTQASSGFMIFLAWLFVALRVGHAYIHIGSNNVMHRMRVFFCSFAVIFAMWITILVHIA